jgi:CTP synthase (UTP-ammonia lyase)
LARVGGRRAADAGEDVDAEWLRTDGERVGDLSGFDAVWLMPGSPYADDRAAYAAITYARTHRVPFLGTCGGLQYAAPWPAGRRIRCYASSSGRRAAKCNVQDTAGALDGNTTSRTAQDLQENWYRPTGQLD